MRRIFIYFLFIVFFIVISGCGSTSSSNTPNIFSTGSLTDALIELETAAENSNLDDEDEEAYGNLFDEETDIGLLDLMSYLLEFMRDFKANADYNEDEERWEINNIDNPLTPDVTEEITYYGEYNSESNFWIHKSTVTDETYGLHVYSGEHSFSCYYPGGTPDYSSDPGIKIEIYQYEGSYYSYFLYQYSDIHTLMVKLKFSIDNSLSELDGKYGEYTNTPPAPQVIRIDNLIPDDIESYPLIRNNYSSNPDSWFTTNVDINRYLVFDYNDSIFGYGLP